ncbi:MAG: polysulfide reductase [Desulfobacteraceae bacterium]|nr:polysulfide reductase [Desulfobacteraceae bacterium]
MKKLIASGAITVNSPQKSSDRKWTFMEKLFLGLTLPQYIGQALRNPFNWIIAIIFAVGIPIILGRFIFGLSWVTHSSNDYPWGLFLAFGLFGMVPLSSSGFLLGTACEVFGRHDLEPIERLGLLNGLLGYFFAVVFLLIDLGQPWRLPFPMVVSFGPAAVLFLVAWHVSTYLSVQIAEVSVSFFEWIGFPIGVRAIRKITLGLTVSGIILSTLHQGALGALFTYAPGKVHPLWYSSSFQWIHFFVSSIPGGLCMVITVSTIASKTMSWRFDQRFKDSLDRVTVSLAKGASMGLATYLTIKLMSIAHDNKWAYLTTGYGQWYLVEIMIGVIIPMTLFAYAIHHKKLPIIRFSALLVVLGIFLNRLNTALITFNWKLSEREIPHWREVAICVTVYTIYIVVYRFILYRLPIFYQWKTQEQYALAYAAKPETTILKDTEPALVFASKTEAKAFRNAETITS